MKNNFSLEPVSIFKFNQVFLIIVLTAFLLGIFAIGDKNVGATHGYTCQQECISNPDGSSTCTTYSCVSPCDQIICSCSGYNTSTCTGIDDGHGACTVSQTSYDSSCTQASCTTDCDCGSGFRCSGGFC